MSLYGHWLTRKGPRLLPQAPTWTNRSGESPALVQGECPEVGGCQSSRRVPIWPLPFFHADSAGSGQLEELPRTRRSESWPRCEATDGRLAVRGDGRQRGAGRRLQIRGQFLFNAEISARSINNQTRSEKIRLVLSLQLYTIHVIQSGGSDKTPAVITHRYSDFQRLHATLRRNYGDQMERVSFPRK
ncbi:hypothetical protein XENOCAPTIV_023943 [Xenoophorus captivus]|uniref:PX domain-containing protein n=1 Tax=Xenoophorus captivus TaxID=1517983 RepID=A0ABV0QWE0_9TELE